MNRYICPFQFSNPDNIIIITDHYICGRPVYIRVNENSKFQRLPLFVGLNSCQFKPTCLDNRIKAKNCLGDITKNTIVVTFYDGMNIKWSDNEIIMFRLMTSRHTILSYIEKVKNEILDLEGKNDACYREGKNSYVM